MCSLVATLEDSVGENSFVTRIFVPMSSIDVLLVTEIAELSVLKAGCDPYSPGVVL